MSIFRSAIQGDDGQVDAGYLALYWTMSVTVGVIPVIVLVAGVACYRMPEKTGEIIQSAGIAIGAICTGCGVVVGSVGAFRMGDKPRVAQQSVTVKTETTTTPAPPKQEEPLQVDVVNLPKDSKKTKR